MTFQPNCHFKQNIADISQILLQESDTLSGLTCYPCDASSLSFLLTSSISSSPSCAGNRSIHCTTFYAHPRRRRGGGGDISILCVSGTTCTPLLPPPPPSYIDMSYDGIRTQEGREERKSMSISTYPAVTCAVCNFSRNYFFFAYLALFLRVRDTTTSTQPTTIGKSSSVNFFHF